MTSPVPLIHVVDDDERISVLTTRYESLTEREGEIFAKVTMGKLNKQIAAELGASERTVKAHRAHVMAKMQVSSLAELVLIAEHLRVAAAIPTIQ